MYYDDSAYFYTGTVYIYPGIGNTSPTATFTFSNAYYDRYVAPRPTVRMPKEWRWFHRFYRAHMPRCPICRADFIYCRCRPRRGQEPRNVHQARQEKRKRYIQSLQ